MMNIPIFFTFVLLYQTNPFQFKHQFIDDHLKGGSWGQTALVDIDRDGDLDFITGQRDSFIHWYEFEKGKPWTLHVIGLESPSDVGAAVMDVDGDGRVDIVTGGAWYRQPIDPNETYWQRHVFDRNLKAVHDLITADVDGDGKRDVITMSDQNDVRWYKIPDGDAQQPWQHTPISDAVHAGISAGDIDGDGDIDLARTQYWIENQDQGKTWVMHKFCGIEWANRRDQPFYYRASRSSVTDINGDGKLDIVLTEAEFPGARIAWFENPGDPKQVPWTIHIIPFEGNEERGPFHTLQTGDYDQDGDIDIFSGEMELYGIKPHRWFIWENAKGDGSEFIEHPIFDGNLGTHEAVAGDVDGDGDIDFAGKPWNAVPDNANGGRNHADYLENISIQ